MALRGNHVGSHSGESKIIATSQLDLVVSGLKNAPHPHLMFQKPKGRAIDAAVAINCGDANKQADALETWACFLLIVCFGAFGNEERRLDPY